MSKKKLSPRNAKTENELCSLQSDNKSVKDYWIMIEGAKISIAKQTLGSEADWCFSIPKRQFNALIDWYNKEQETI